MKSGGIYPGSAFTPEETAVSENLPVDVFRVCAQTHFSFYQFFNPLSYGSSLSSAPGSAGAAPLLPCRAAETRGRGEGRRVPRVTPPAATQGSARGRGAALRAGAPTPRGGFGVSVESRRWIGPIFWSQEGTGPVWCHPPVKAAWGCPGGGEAAPDAHTVLPYLCGLGVCRSLVCAWQPGPGVGCEGPPLRKARCGRIFR